MDKYIYFVKDKKRTHNKINRLISGEALCWPVFRKTETIEVYYYNNKNY